MTDTHAVLKWTLMSVTYVFCSVTFRVCACAWLIASVRMELYADIMVTIKTAMMQNIPMVVFQLFILLGFFILYWEEIALLLLILFYDNSLALQNADAFCKAKALINCSKSRSNCDRLSDFIDVLHCVKSNSDIINPYLWTFIVSIDIKF